MQPPDPTAAPPSAPGKHSSFEFVAHAPVLGALSGTQCVLDLGCGRGDWSLGLARRGIPVLAIDLWVDGLAWLAAQSHGLPLLALRADVTAPLPLANGSVDGALLALLRERGGGYIINISSLAGTNGLIKSGDGALVLSGGNRLSGTLNIDTDSGSLDGGFQSVPADDRGRRPQEGQEGRRQVARLA